MLQIKIILFAMPAFRFTVCGQFYKKHAYKELTAMETSKLTNTTVIAVFDAWQTGDSKKWLSFLQKMSNYWMTDIQEILKCLA